MTEPEVVAHCPNPECTFGAKVRRQPVLDSIESNVSGTGVDLMSCRSCGRHYYVSYRVHQVIRIDPNTAEPMQ